MRVLPHESVRTKTREISTGSVDELTCVSSYYSTARLRGSQGMRWQTSRIRVLGEIVAGEVWGVRLRRFHLRRFAATADKSRLRRDRLRMLVARLMARPEAWPRRSSPKASEVWRGVWADFRNWIVRAA